MSDQCKIFRLSIFGVWKISFEYPWPSDGRKRISSRPISMPRSSQTDAVRVWALFTAGTLWTASNCGRIQISSFSLPVSTPFMVTQNWISKKNIRKNFSLSKCEKLSFSAKSLIGIKFYFQVIEKIDKFRFKIEYKIFSFDFRRKFRVEKKIFES